MKLKILKSKSCLQNWNVGENGGIMKEAHLGRKPFLRRTSLRCDDIRCSSISWTVEIPLSFYLPSWFLRSCRFYLQMLSLALFCSSDGMISDLLSIASFIPLADDKYKMFESLRHSNRYYSTHCHVTYYSLFRNYYLISAFKLNFWYYKQYHAVRLWM